jgi:hypothetical protein
MNVRHEVYEDGVIAVALVSLPERELGLAIRWLDPGQVVDRDGHVRTLTNVVGGETAWFCVPHTFAAAIGRKLVEQKAAGLPGFDEDGFAALVAWLKQGGELDDTMCY